MPELSRFYGIVITMYPEPGARHRRPHFHARYSGSTAVYDFRHFHLLVGSMPAAQQERIVEWATIHQSELVQNWLRLQRGERPLPIDPLP